MNGKDNMESQNILKSYLDSIFNELSNLSYKIVDFQESYFIIAIIKKSNCFYDYKELRSVLSGNFIYDYEDTMYSLDFAPEKTSKENEFKINFKVERCDD